MNKLFNRILLLGFLTVILSACESLRNPIRTNDIGDVEIAAMGAQDRAIIASRDGVGQPYKYCAEPPPDAVGNLAQSISAALRAEVGRPGKDAGASFVAANNLAQTVERIYTRSHAVQLFRDASFSLCQAYLIGASRDNTNKELVVANEELAQLYKRRSDSAEKFTLHSDEVYDIEESLYDQGIDVDSLSRAEEIDLQNTNPDLKRLKKLSEELIRERRVIRGRIGDVEKNIIVLSQQAQNYLTSFSDLMDSITPILKLEIAAFYDAELVAAKTKVKFAQPDSVSITDVLKTVSELTTAQADALVDAINKLPKTDTAVCSEGEKKNEEGKCEKENAVKDGEGKQISDVSGGEDTESSCTDEQIKDKNGNCVDKPVESEEEVCPEGQQHNEKKECVAK